jgi:hypothetical protein
MCRSRIDCPLTPRPMDINNAIVLSDDDDLEEKPSSAQATLDTNLDTKAPDSLVDSDSDFEPKAAVSADNAAKKPKTTFFERLPRMKKRAVEHPKAPPSRQLDLRLIKTPIGVLKTVSSPSYARAEWPAHVVHLAANFNPDGIKLPSVPHYGPCGCTSPCRHDSCSNALTGILCTPKCCKHGDKCGNGLRSCEDIVLMKDLQTASLGVVATKTIPKGVTVGEYLGRLTLDRPSKDRVCNRGYRLLLYQGPKNSGKYRACIDAELFGSMMRFVNHSCFPSAAFYERSNGATHTVVVATLREVYAGQELTVDYGNELWFVCKCGREGCCHRSINNKKVP